LSEWVYLLDTDSVSNYLDERRQHPRLRERIVSADPTAVCISIVTVEEMLRGALDVIRQAQTNRRSTSASYALLQQLVAALHDFHIVPYTEEADQIYHAMPAAVRRIGANDCRIAATAIAGNYVVVTLNTRHFAAIPNVRYEDWTTN
jgi:tRNA(fMet)-specific endonuclease VapC